MKILLPLLLTGSFYLAAAAHAEYQRLDGIVAIVDEDIITQINKSPVRSLQDFATASEGHDKIHLMVQRDGEPVEFDLAR